MNVKTAYSTRASVLDAANEIRQQLLGVEPTMVLYFASSTYAPAALSEAMQTAFGATTVIGCTTAGEIADGIMLRHSIVAMAFTKAALKRFRVALVEDVNEKKTLKEKIVRAMKSFEECYGAPASKLDPGRLVGLILIDGLCRAEERVMEKIGDLTDVTFLGGAAGDDRKFEKTYIYGNGKAYTNAALLAMIEPATPFDVIKTQSFRCLGKKLLATEVDEDTRTVMRFDGKPAASAYADALGVPLETASESFEKNPLGLMLDDEPYVRSPQRIDNGHIVFYCNIKKGMELSVLESTDIVHDTRAAIEKSRAKLGSISGIISFSCILRRLELEKDGLVESYGKVFSGAPTIGFSTYGEEYIGHINQTATMLVLG